LKAAISSVRSADPIRGWSASTMNTASK